jgi:hypothetical protein
MVARGPRILDSIGPYISSLRFPFHSICASLSLPMTPDTAAPRLAAATPLMPPGPGPLGRHGPGSKKHDPGSMRHGLSRARAWPGLSHRAWVCISAYSAGTDTTRSNGSHGSQSLIPFPHAPRPLDLPILGEGYIRPPESP